MSIIVVDVLIIFKMFAFRLEKCFYIFNLIYAIMADIIIKNLILIFLLLAAFIILFSFLTFIMSIKPGKWPIEFTPESLNLEYENVTFETSDGLKLKGWFLPSNKSNNTS